jgi:hypothetical protein
MAFGCASSDAPDNSSYPQRGVAAVLVLLALLISACGGSSPSSDATRAASVKNKQQSAMLEFAQCMRSHGVNYPDPAPDGRLNFTGTLGPGDNAAIKACARKMPAAPPKTAAQRKRTSEAMLALTKCLRAHGGDVDDPVTDADGDTTFTGRGNLPPAAQRDCKALFQKAGVRPPQPQ